MKILRFILPVFFFGALILQACAPAAPSEAAIQTAIAKTQAAYTPTPVVLSPEQKYAKNLQGEAQTKLTAFGTFQDQWATLMKTSEIFDTLDPVNSYADYIKYVFDVYSIPNASPSILKMMNHSMNEKNKDKVTRITILSESLSTAAYEAEIALGVADVPTAVGVPHKKIVECLQAQQKFHTLILDVLTKDYVPSGNELSYPETNMSCKYYQESLQEIQDFAKVNAPK